MGCLFKPKSIQAIIEDNKTQTRRAVKPGEWAVGDGILVPPLENCSPNFKTSARIHTVYNASGRLKWQVGRDYAVQPGRGKPGVWWMPSIKQWTLPEDHILRDPSWRPLRIRILEIRREPLQAISETDAIAEGYPYEFPPRGPVMHPHQTSPHLWYRELWQSINARAPYRWEDNPDVWVLKFEVMCD